MRTRTLELAGNRHSGRVLPWLPLVLGVAVTSVQPAAADNWPRFRGPNGEGISADKDIPVRWDDKDGLLWTTALPGSGNSSPVVWGDRLFVETAPNAKERQLLCLDVRDGRVLWTKAVPGAKGHTHPRNTLASSTPATDGARVYALFWDGTDAAVHAYDFEGRPVWQYDLGPFYTDHGVGVSPVVYDGLVYVSQDQDKFKDKQEEESGFPGRVSQLIALDAKTGTLVWRAPRRAFRTSYATPFLYRGHGTAEVIVATTASISGYDPKTGAEKWQWHWSFRKQPLRTVGSPVLAHGLVFASTGNGPGERCLVAVRKGGRGDVTKTNLVWQTYKGLAPYVPTMLSWGDHVYFAGDKGTAGCFDARTGALVWNERLHAGDISPSPVLIDGKIYAVTDDGAVYVFRAAPKFELLAKNALGEGTRATPAVANGRLFLRGQKHLFCVGKSAK